MTFDNLTDISTLQLHGQFMMAELRGVDLSSTISTLSCYGNENQQTVIVLTLNLAASLCLPSVGMMFGNMPLLYSRSLSLQGDAGFACVKKNNK